MWPEQLSQTTSIQTTIIYFIPYPPPPITPSSLLPHPTPQRKVIKLKKMARCKKCKTSRQHQYDPAKTFVFDELSSSTNCRHRRTVNSMTSLSSKRQSSHSRQILPGREMEEVRVGKQQTLVYQICDVPVGRTIQSQRWGPAPFVRTRVLHGSVLTCFVGSLHVICHTPSIAFRH